MTYNISLLHHANATVLLSNVTIYGFAIFHVSLIVAYVLSAHRPKVDKANMHIRYSLYLLFYSNRNCLLALLP